MLTNCVNCGAPLHGNKCKYCGTEYNGGGVYAAFERGEATGTISIDGVEYQVYLGSMEAHTICSEAYRNETGRLCTGNMGIKHTFSLIEL